MRTIAIALSTLMLVTGVLSFASAPPAAIQGYSGDPVPVATQIRSGVIQLAESNHRSNAKLGDKYMSGRAGGRCGTGGTESKVFKKT